MHSFLIRNGLLYTALFGAYLLFLLLIVRENLTAAAILTDWITFTLLYGIMLLHNYLIGKWFNRRYFLVYGVLIVVLPVIDGVIGYGIYRFTGAEFLLPSYLIPRWILVVVGTLVHFNYLYFKQRQERTETQLLKRELELTQLKQQLNPHFLYNALNNIYGYMLQDEGRDGKELLLRLSEFMRHLTESMSKQEVTLAASCVFVRDYVLLEQARLGNRCTVQLDFGKAAQSSLTIPPLLFFPLVENAFKHGTGTLQHAYVNVEVVLESAQLLVRIANSVPVSPQQAPSTGRGLEIVRRRMELLYPGQFELGTYRSNDRFVCELKVQLA